MGVAATQAVPSSSETIVQRVIVANGEPTMIVVRSTGQDVATLSLPERPAPQLSQVTPEPFQTTVPDTQSQGS